MNTILRSFLFVLFSCLGYLVISSGCILPLRQYWSNPQTSPVTQPSKELDPVPVLQATDLFPQESESEKGACAFEPSLTRHYKWIVYNELPERLPPEVTARVMLRNTLLVLEYTVEAAAIILGHAAPR
jgi:hypothetical protein